MAKAHAKKKEAAENELMVHSDLIANPNVKAYIEKRKKEKLAAKRAKEIKAGMWKKSVALEDSEDESEEVAAPVLAKIKAKTQAKKQGKITKKVISKWKT